MSESQSINAAYKGIEFVPEAHLTRAGGGYKATVFLRWSQKPLPVKNLQEIPPFKVWGQISLIDKLGIKESREVEEEVHPSKENRICFRAYPSNVNPAGLYLDIFLVTEWSSIFYYDIIKYKPS